MKHAAVGTIRLFPNIHVSNLPYLNEDLGILSIYGLRSPDFRRWN
jgi:hypothetical protein